MLKIFFDPKLDFSFLPVNCEYADKWEASDIAIFMASVPDEARKKHDDIYLVLCATRDEIVRMGSLKGFSDIWILPMVGSLWEMRMENLVASIRKNRQAEMEKSWLETLIDSMPDMVWFKSLDGLHMKVNSAFCKAAGKTRRMIEGRDHYFIWNVDKNSADYDETCVTSEDEVIKANKTCMFNEVLKIGDEKRHLITYKTPVHDTKGKIVGTVGVAHDITNLLNLNMEMEIFLEAMPFPLLMLDQKGIVSHANGKFSDFFHERKNDIIGANYSEWKRWFFTDEDGCLVFTDKNGDARYVGALETDLKDIFGNSMGSVAVFSDITAEKNLEKEIRRNACEDHLTGLSNRRALKQYSEKLKGNFHLIYIDLDNFKSVNDRFGHEAGDAVLKKIAETMRKTCPDDFLSRLGGDEFLIVRETGDDIQLVLEKIQTEFNLWIARDERFKGIGLSIGVRENCAGEPIDKLIHEADQAMYEAKRSGKGQVKKWGEVFS